MTIENELKKLELAFNDVAKAVKTELPEIWQDTMEIYGSEKLSVEFLCRSNMMLNGRRPVDMARGNEDEVQAVKNLLGRIKYGVY